ncbi:KR domain-containing protein [Annulohypoxylon maeteangense]|uniref:KR domain-containing protein n=1 Tax=Annulohypoxylon maeteangense TaxID=1927788 RepID=UPI0020075806|nr:KR domain-containing protein [Annulohypoxylon maeteangense]KAI0886565.1 KR domain-containing protein [Annulohypoxylon maeteangense]
MPALTRSPSSSSGSSYDERPTASHELPTPDTAASSASSSMGADEYPALSFPGYAEKPLDEQLEPIAVIGMGCRLPGDVNSPSEFWNLMMEKRSGQTPKVPKSRFNIDAHIHENNDRPGSFAVLGGYFLNGELSDFDPGLFGITPVEAMWMDPQQRKLLEVVYEALESGGISLEKISGTRTAVFAASFTADWQQMAFKEPSFRHSLAATGVDPGLISNRISHVFNLNGPSIMCNTACSSSVYALHNACNALRNREAEGAIVGGVNLIITVDQHMNTAKLGVLSPTSTCHTFNADADGYGRADAVGAVYLKRLSDAIRDGDPIRGVIRSTATNSNGKVPAAGITHPNREGQMNVITAAYKRGGDLDPRLTGYFECHGTGTAVGDPLEVNAVAMAMNKNRQPGEEPLLIGAVKPNIGHSEAASGLSALIKGIMIVERGLIPAIRGVTDPSPAIMWDEWKVKVPTKAVPFPRELPVRRVSINSFGYGGTNAHIIVEDTQSLTKHAPRYTYLDSWTQKQRFVGRRRAVERKRSFLLPFSAHDKATLRRNIDAHGKVAAKYNLLDLSYTLSNRRSSLPSKAYAVASYNSLNSVFNSVSENFTFADKKSIRSVGFVFTGQGAQWARMGAELMVYCPHFLHSIRALDLVLEELNDGPEWSIEDVLLEQADTSPVNDAEFSQPLCTAIQIAVVQLLEYWGICPTVTVGHSSGEIAAAYAAGLISSDEAIIAAYYRGQVAKDMSTGGAMMAVGLGAEAVEPYLTKFKGKVGVACHNSPSLVTLSGDNDAIEAVKVDLDGDGVFARPVKTNGKAYHSHHIDPVAQKYEALLRAAKKSQNFSLPLSTTAKMVSSVTNSILPAETNLDARYWTTNLRSPVLFNQAVGTILGSEQFADVDLFIEVGPHSAMASSIKQIKAKAKAENIEYIPTLLRGNDCAAQLLKVAGEMFLRNYPVDMEKVSSAYIEAASADGKMVKGSTIVDLPSYQWNYTRSFWAESRSSREQRQPKFPRHDVLGQLVIGGSLAEPTWRNVLRIRDLPWLKHHHLGGESVFPAAGYFSMAIEAIRQINELKETPIPIESYAIRDVSIKTALVTPDDDDGIEIVLSMRPSLHGSEWWDWNVSSIDNEGVKKDHMSGSIGINTRPRGKTPRKIPDFPQRATGKAWNQALREVGFDYGETFQDMDDIRFDGKRYQAACATNIKQVVMKSLGESRYVLHPACIDSTLQLCIAAIYAGRTNAIDCGVVPVSVDEVVIWPPTEKQLKAEKANAYAVVHRRGIRTSESTVQLTAQDGEMVMEITNMRATAYEAAVPQKAESALEDAPYGEMTWDLDFDTAENRSGLTTSDLMNLALFKYPNAKVIELGAMYAPKILAKNPRAQYTIIVSSDEEAKTADIIISGYHNAKVITVQSSEGTELQNLKEGSYDIMIASQEEQLTPQLRRLLGHGANVINSEITITTANSEISEYGSRSVQLVYRNSESPAISKVKTALESLSWNIDVISLDASLELSISEHVVMLADFEGPLLFDCNEQEFSAVQNIIAKTSSLLWVSIGGLTEGKKPEYAMVSGLARTVTSEQASLDFRVLDIDVDNTSLEAIAKSVTNVALLQATKSEKLPEREFSISNGKTYISRLLRQDDLNSIFRNSGKAEPENFHVNDRISGRILKSKVVFQREAATDDIQQGHVEIEVLSSGLTKEGVLAISGSDYATTFSHEIGGIVKRVGAGVPGLEAGDKVVGFNVGYFNSYQQVPAPMLQKIRNDEDIDGCVSTLMAYATALHGLETLASVRKGENVLVLSNSGFAGAAAIKIAQLKNAIPYVVVQTDDEFEFIRNQLGVDASHILKASGGLVSERLEGLTNGHGADIVFSAGSVDSGMAHEAWRCIASFGRFLDSGRKVNLSRNVLDGIPVHRSASYIPFDILEVYQSRPGQLSELLPTIVGLWERRLIVSPGKIKPVNLAGLDKAVSAFSDVFGAAKSVVQFQESEAPIQIMQSRPELQFSPDASYLLVGCLGGLGRSLTSWMVESGARRFTFLSRSGADSKSAAQLVRDLEATGAFVQIVRGDVTSREDVLRAVNGISTKYPIKGVVHAAMVLRDGLFHSMEYKAWKQSTKPKVIGAMNLHSVLAGKSLDFFIMTSSVSGILGTPGQSNYAAANAYLDSLARHRLTHNNVATSIVLPMILGVGVVAENAELEDALKRKGMYGIDEEHLLQSFEAAMISSNLRRVPDHVAPGLDPARLQKAVNDTASTDSFWLEDARFSHVVHAISSSADDTTGGAGSQSILATIKAASSADEAISAVNEHFIDKLARMLMLDAEDINPDAGSIASYGIDSMIGAELRNWIFKEYRMDVPFQQLLGPTLTITKFATQVCAAQGVGT